MNELIPFRIDIPENTLTDLKSRLAQTRWTDEPDQAEWNYGVNPKYLRELADYWQHTYDWRKHEAELNQFIQFTTVIDDVKVHFIHVKGKANPSKPLILTHGWPDSIYRFIKVIPLLTDPENFGGSFQDSFDVIIPSLPGFGFSDRIAMNTDQIAVLWNKLMTNVLGYETYYAAGGDVGSTVTKSLANQFPDAVKAIHLTDVGYPNGSEDWSKMSVAEQEYGKFIQNWMQKEGAYNMIQSTKPQTLGYGLNDSPVGLAAWIVEKFYAWSDTKGDIEIVSPKTSCLPIL